MRTKKITRCLTKEDVIHCPYKLQYADDALKADRDVVLAVVKKKGRALTFASATLKADRDLVLAAVTQDGMALQYASVKLKNHCGVVLAAVKINGWALKYADDALKEDPAVVLAAVSQYGWALQYASVKLKNHCGVVLAAVKINGLALQYASTALKANRDVLLAAVTQHGDALRFVSPESELNADPEVVLAAVAQNGITLAYASAALRADRAVVLAAVIKDGGALEYASAALKSDRDVVLVAVAQVGHALKYASEALKKDHEVVLAAVKQSGSALKFASVELKADREVVLAAVTIHGTALQYASDALQSDLAVVLAAVNQDRWALQFASTELQSDPAVLLAVTNDRRALQLIQTLVGLSMTLKDTLTITTLPEQVDVVSSWASSTRQTKLNRVITPGQIKLTRRPHQVMPDCDCHQATAEITFTFPDGNKLNIKKEDIEAICRLPLHQVVTHPKLARFNPIISYRKTQLSSVIISHKSPSDVHVSNYILLPKIPGAAKSFDDRLKGYKDADGRIHVFSDSCWQDLFPLFKRNNPIKSPRDFVTRNIVALESAIATDGNDFASVLQQIKLANQMPAATDKTRIATCLQAWLNNFSSEGEAGKQHRAELSSFLDELELKRDPAFKKNAMHGDYISDHVSCISRAKLFMYFISLTPWKDDFAIIINQIHAYVASIDGKAYDLGGIPAEISYADSTSDTTAPGSRHQLGRSISSNSVCQLVQTMPQLRVSSSDSSELSLGESPIKKSTVALTSAPFTGSDCSASTSEMISSSRFSELPLDYNPMRKSIDVEKSAPLIGIDCIASKLENISSSRAPELALDDCPIKSRLIAPSWADVCQAVYMRHPDHYIFIIENTKDVNSDELKQVYSEGSPVVLLFDLTQGDTDFDQHTFQTYAKQCCDTESPRLDDQAIRSTWIRYFYQGKTLHEQPLLPSLLSRVPGCYQLPAIVAGSTIAAEEGSLAIAEEDSLEVDDSLGVLATAFFNIDINEVPGQAHLFQRTVSLKPQLTDYLSDAPFEISDCDRKTVTPIIIRTTNITAKDRIDHQRINHHLAQGKIFLIDRWYYVNPSCKLEITLQATPSLSQSKWQTQICSPVDADDGDTLRVNITLNTETSSLRGDTVSELAHEVAILGGGASPSFVETASQETCYITPYSQFWMIKTDDEAEPGQKHIRAEKTPLYKTLQENIRQENTIRFIGSTTPEQQEQMAHFGPYVQYVEQDKIPVDTVTSIKQIHGACLLKCWLVNNPRVLVSMGQDEGAIEGSSIAASESLKDWLEKPTSHLVLDGQTMTDEELCVLSILKNTCKGPAHVVFQNQVYDIPDMPIQAMIVNPRIHLPDIEDATLSDEQQSALMFFLHFQLNVATQQDEIIYNITNRQNVSIIHKLLSRGMSPSNLQHLFAPNAETAPLSFTADYVDQLEDYIDIRPAIRQTIELLKSVQHCGVLLEGPPGIGKSLLAFCLASRWHADDEIFVFKFDGEPSVEDLEKLAHAYSHGGTCIIDEFEHPKWQTKLNTLSTTAHHDDFFVIASSNFPRIGQTNLAVIKQTAWSLQEQCLFLSACWDQSSMAEYQDQKKAYLQHWKQKLRRFSRVGSLDARTLSRAFSDWVTEILTDDVQERRTDDVRSPVSIFSMPRKEYIKRDVEEIAKREGMIYSGLFAMQKGLIAAAPSGAAVSSSSGGGACAMK